MGCVLLPASGCLDLASKTTDGIDATWVRLWSGSKGNQRVRLPRAFTADGVLRPYNEEEARGQVGCFWHLEESKFSRFGSKVKYASLWLVKRGDEFRSVLINKDFPFIPAPSSSSLMILEC